METRYKELWNAFDVRCPFYISDDRPSCSLTCEGYSDGLKLTTKFRSIAQKNIHMGQYCVSKYENCPVAHLVQETRYPN